MTRSAYRLFALVAWPAAAWCGIELVLRVLTGETAGAAGTALVGVLAGGTVVLARWRGTGAPGP